MLLAEKREKLLAIEGRCWKRGGRLALMTLELVLMVVFQQNRLDDLWCVAKDKEDGDRLGKCAKLENKK